jgi:hypothetical protein
MTIRARATPSEDRVLGEMERSDERDLDARVKKFAAQQPTRKPHSEPVELDVEPEPTPKSNTTPDLPSALMDVADLLMENHDKPATLGHLAWALNKVARLLTKEPRR